VGKSVFKGVPINYVSTATGEVTFAVNDITFAESSALFFTRVYSSNNNEDTGLGKGWSYAFNDKIEVNFDKATLTSSAGEKYQYVGMGFRFTETGRTQEFVLKTDEPALVQGFQQIGDNLIKEKNALAEKTYEKFGDAFYPTRIKLANNQEVFLERARDGRLSKISNNNDEIKLSWSEGQNQRLHSISDSTGRSVKFQQNADELKSVKSVLDGQWKYDYSNGKLSKVTDPLNRIQLQVVYDNSGRAVKSGDAVELTTFKYENDGRSFSIRTSIIDSMNYALLVEHNDNGSIKQTFDENGSFANFKYDSSNRVTAVTDENGQVASFEFDSKDKLIRKFVRNQGEESFQYDEKGNVTSINYGNRQVKMVYDNNNLPIERNITQGEVTTKIKLDKNGNPVNIVGSDGRRIDFEYDNRGREIATTFSNGGRFETAYNQAGKKSAEKLPSGLTYNFKYNNYNQLTGKSDTKGRAAHAEYDQSGAITKVGNDKIWVKNTRDSFGRIVKVESSSGKSRNFRYNSRGALTQYTNAKGEKFEFSYDERGKLKKVESPKGVIYGKREIKKPNEVAFVKSNFSTKSSSALDLSIDLCDTFGGDGLIEPGTDLTYEIEPEVLCDPFAGSGGFDDFGGLGGFGGSGEGRITCEECNKDKKSVCGSNWRACVRNVIGTTFGVGAFCLLGVPPLSLVCAAIVGVAGGTQLAACDDTYYGCITNIKYDCASYCNR
jgi:YD repeat-containing protein